MYGQHKTPLRLTEGRLSVSFDKQGERYVYRRTGAGGNVERIVLDGPEKIIINPVEPLNLPKPITQYLMIEFSEPVVIGPSGDKTVLLKLPVEIGIFLSRKKGTKLIDTISLNQQKFTLYGSPRGGTVCRYWKSEVFAEIPATDPLLEAVLALRITSEVENWVTVKKVVLDAYGMKIRYTETLVATKAEMEIISDGIAETGFVEAALQQGMQKSAELLRLGKLSVTSARYHMGEGL
jgi:hypothetical protein